MWAARTLQLTWNIVGKKSKSYYKLVFQVGCVAGRHVSPSLSFEVTILEAGKKELPLA